MLLVDQTESRGQVRRNDNESMNLKEDFAVSCEKHCRSCFLGYLDERVARPCLSTIKQEQRAE